MKKFYGQLFVLALLIFACLQAFGQGTDASITGKVKDDLKNPVPGASVVIKNESTGFENTKWHK
ncbi:MAG: carboxypeptidase-like regulatory domain-containing protein [Bacteroidota bacterium]|nr:carboxypeptidase-like regulatory domain-containing protein [Bacteroidota bacterium]